MRDRGRQGEGRSCSTRSAASTTSKLQNPQKATAAYLEALEVAAEDHQLLQKVLDLYTETKQWKKAVETIERFIALETDSVPQGRVLPRRGDDVPRRAEVARRGGRLLQQRARQLLRAAGEAADESMLPRALQVVRGDRQDAHDEARLEGAGARVPRHDQAPAEAERQPRCSTSCRSACSTASARSIARASSSTSRRPQAYELAQQLDPKNELRADGTDRAEILAELYLVAGPDYTDKAVEQHMRMLRNEPFKYDSYKALRRIYMDTHQYDKTWCVCNTLAFLKKADAGRAAVLRAVQAARPGQGQERDEPGDAGPSSSTPTRTATSPRSSARAGRASRR